jgi:hypothetical protein
MSVYVSTKFQFQLIVTRQILAIIIAISANNNTTNPLYCLKKSVKLTDEVETLNSEIFLN